MGYTVAVRIEWDDAKNEQNQRKHGVSFEEAQELLLSDDDYLEIYDEAHSDTEDRFIAIGPIRRGLVMVVWTERDEEAVRIISARWCTKRETSLYEGHQEKKT